MTDSWSPQNRLRRLDAQLFNSAARFKDIDDLVWLYLLDLIPEDGRSYRERKREVLDRISPELRRYYLVRGFDAERGSGGLESCVMHEQHDDDLFLRETISAYRSLGAPEHARIIEELIPLAEARLKALAAADDAGEALDDEDDRFGMYESRWDEACSRLNVFGVIFADMKAHPDRYCHSMGSASRGHSESPK